MQEFYPRSQPSPGALCMKTAFEMTHFQYPDSDSCLERDARMDFGSVNMLSFENESGRGRSNESVLKTPVGQCHLQRTGTASFPNCSIVNGMECYRSNDGNRRNNLRNSAESMETEVNSINGNAFILNRSMAEGKLGNGSVLKKMTVLPFTPMVKCASKTENTRLSNHFKKDSTGFKSIQERKFDLRCSIQSSTPDLVSNIENSPLPCHSKRNQEPAETSTMPDFRFELEKFFPDENSKSQPGYDLESVQPSKIPNVKFVQVNGQRKYGGPPPGWIGPPPPKGCEVFIGSLPRDIFEDELMPLFQAIGVLYEFRLIIQFSCSSKGFAFAKYTNKTDAKMAIDCLDGYEIRPRRRIGVIKSTDNCKLYIGGVPTKKTNVQVFEEMSKFTDGVSRVLLYPNLADRSRNRGFAFVEYESHRAASLARRVLLSGEVGPFNKNISVDWAEPEPDVDEDYMREVASLYVRNIPLHVEEEALKEIFSFNGNFLVQKVKKVKDFAFVHFFKREVAEKALLQFNGINLDGLAIEITWAKPRVQRRVTLPAAMHTTESRQPLMHGVSNGLVTSCDLFNNPVLLLHCISAEYGFGEPIYRVSQAVADQPSGNITFTAQVSIPNWPFPVKQFMTNGNLSTPYEAKQKVAMCALKSVEFYKSVFDSCAFPFKYPAEPICTKGTDQPTAYGTRGQSEFPTEYSEFCGSQNSHATDYGGPVSDLDLLPTAVALANMLMK